MARKQVSEYEISKRCSGLLEKWKADLASLESKLDRDDSNAEIEGPPSENGPEEYIDAGETKGDTLTSSKEDSASVAEVKEDPTASVQSQEPDIS